MFSYVFMKLLERRPPSYDQRIDTISRGHISAVKQAIADNVPIGARVLEIGCGTGDLAGMLIARGATVEGFDLSPAMVKAAGDKIDTEGLGDKFRIHQMGVDGMDDFLTSAYDVVVSTLVFSELTDDERRFALAQAARVLRPGGMMMIADEVRPGSKGRRLVHTLVRAPMLALTYLVTRTATTPIADLTGDLVRAGFMIDKEELSRGDTFALVISRKPNEKEIR